MCPGWIITSKLFVLRRTIYLFPSLPPPKFDDQEEANDRDKDEERDKDTHIQKFTSLRWWFLERNEKKAQYNINDRKLLFKQI